MPASHFRTLTGRRLERLMKRYAETWAEYQRKRNTVPWWAKQTAWREYRAARAKLFAEIERMEGTR